MIVIPPSQLPPDTLQAMIESFIVREGTDYGDVEQNLAHKVAQVNRQLERGDVLIIWDESTESCNLLTRHAWQQFQGKS